MTLTWKETVETQIRAFLAAMGLLLILYFLIMVGWQYYILDPFLQSRILSQARGTGDLSRPQLYVSQAIFNGDSYCSADVAVPRNCEGLYPHPEVSLVDERSCCDAEDFRQIHFVALGKDQVWVDIFLKEDANCASDQTSTFLK